MRDSLRVGSIVFVLLMIAGACAEDKVSLPDPVPEPVRMADIGPAGGGADMTMAAGPDNTAPSSSAVSTTAQPSTVVTTTAASSTVAPTTMALPSTTRWTAPTTLPEAEPTSTSATPDTPFVVAVATVDMLEVFDEPDDDEALWLLPNPGPGDGPRTLLVLDSEETPTPPGGFFVTEVQEHTDPATGDTTWLIGTSAYSEALDSTADGDPAVAILAVGDAAHLSQAISLGCVRIHPDVLERLALLPLGTPVQILG